MNDTTDSVKSETPETAEDSAGSLERVVRHPELVTQLDMAFGGSMEKLLPKWSEIPDEYKRGGNKWVRLVSRWFFSGLPKTTTFKAKEGIDANAALRHVGAIMRSFEPGHEHKEAGCAYLLAMWFDDIIAPDA